MINIKKLNFEFNDTQGKVNILRNLNLSIKEGEIISIVGPSGCGKTTFAKIFSGYLFPLKGKMEIEGKKFSGPGKERVLVFQEDDLFPWMTVKQNINFFSNDPKITNNLLKIVGLPKYSNFYPSQISGGMKKRISLIRAFAENPKVIILDEAFSYLDSLLKEKLYEEILKIWNISKKTIVIITHDIEEAIFLSDRVVIMSSKPAKIKEIVNINFKRPRKKELIFSPEFYKLRKKIKKLLN